MTAIARMRTQGSLAASGQSAARVEGRSVDISLSGTWTGTATLQRYMSDGWQETGFSWTGNTEATVTFATLRQIRLNWTRSSGTLVYDLVASEGVTGANSTGTNSSGGSSLPASLGPGGGLKTEVFDSAGTEVNWSGITTVYQLLTALNTTNGANIKNGAGRVYWIRGRNNRASSVFIKLYNKATGPTVGSDTPVDTFEAVASQPFVLDFPIGLAFATGIGIAMTTAAAVADTGALTAGDITCLSVGYT